MGTLFNQSERRWARVSNDILDDFLSDVVNLAKKHKISVTDVIAAKQALEIERQNNLYVANGDTFDEQMMGFGELLQEISATLRDRN